jgi:hypothetical protein
MGGCRQNFGTPVKFLLRDGVIAIGTRNPKSHVQLAIDFAAKFLNGYRNADYAWSGLTPGFCDISGFAEFDAGT